MPLRRENRNLHGQEVLRLEDTRSNEEDSWQINGTFAANVGKIRGKYILVCYYDKRVPRVKAVLQFEFCFCLVPKVCQVGLPKVYCIKSIQILTHSLEF